MNKTDTELDFTPAERAYIRSELDEVLGALPTVGEGFLLRHWKSGPKKGEAKLSPPAQTLIDRGLMHVVGGAHWSRLRFTERGLLALRRMMADRRFADPQKFAHTRRELGLEGQTAREEAD